MVEFSRDVVEFSRDVVEFSRDVVEFSRDVVEFSRDVPTARLYKMLSIEFILFPIGNIVLDILFDDN